MMAVSMIYFINMQSLTQTNGFLAPVCPPIYKIQMCLCVLTWRAAGVMHHQQTTTANRPLPYCAVRCWTLHCINKNNNNTLCFCGTCCQRTGLLIVTEVNINANSSGIERPAHGLSHTVASDESRILVTCGQHAWSQRHWEQNILTPTQYYLKDVVDSSIHMCERLRHKAGGHRGLLPASCKC